MRILPAAVIIAVSAVPALAQRAPLSWEALDHSRPIYLVPQALVCRTMRQVHAAILRADESGPGCMRAPSGQRVQVTWMGRGDGENVRFQHVRGRINGRPFDGWALGMDLTDG